MKNVMDIQDQAVFRFLREYGCCPLADIAEGLDASAWTMARKVRSMHRAGRLVYRQGIGYDINARQASVLVVMLETGRLRARACDLDGHVQWTAEREIAGLELTVALAGLVETAKLACPNLRMVMISVAGLAAGGRLIKVAGMPGLAGLDLAAELHKRCGLEAGLCNDANAMAYGYALSRGADNVVYLYNSVYGTGMGAVVDGRLLTGAGGIAGEVEHIWPPQDGDTQLKSQVMAALAVLDPAELVVAAEPEAPVDRAALSEFVRRQRPHSGIRVRFTGWLPAKTDGGVMGRVPEHREDCFCGLTALAVEQLLGTGGTPQSRRTRYGAAG